MCRVKMRMATGSINDVSAPRPTLLPLFRSENQVRLLAALLFDPLERYTITELADRTGIPQPSVSREVKHLIASGVVRADVERGRRLIGADVESPILPELTSLMLKTVGPVAVLEDALRDLPGVDAAYVYGSWARRYTGEPGDAPRDIDLLVVGRPDVRDVRQRADEASRVLSRDVNVTVLTPGEWADPQSAFLRHVKSSILVPVVDVKSSGSASTPHRKAAV